MQSMQNAAVENNLNFAEGRANDFHSNTNVELDEGSNIQLHSDGIKILNNELHSAADVQDQDVNIYETKNVEFSEGKTKVSDDKMKYVLNSASQSSTNIKPDLQDCSNEMKVLNSSEYVMRASTMRAKIEEKITEIERKMAISDIDISSDSESYSSPSDYNMIKVLDTRQARSCSVSEMRQSTIERLQSKLEKAEKDLELREEEIFRLRKIRDEVGSEIEDLTASLFEEANNMVRKAQMSQRKAERMAKETNMKLGMLQEEVSALKAIVQSTKMCTPVEENEVSEKKVRLPPRPAYEVDPIFNSEFVEWRQDPSFDKNSPFLKRIYAEDIQSCLNFKNKELSEIVLAAIEDDKITIEKIPTSTQDPLPKVCALMNAPRLCPYKMCIEGNSCYSISTLSRNRLPPCQHP
ncbi:Guanine nucleotide exchange factor for Rab-3A, partial [Stegodyphus mimosarum]